MKMKINIFSAFLMLSVLALISSCSKDSEEDFKEISQEDSKVKLQENGIAFTNEMEALKNVKSADALISFSDLMETDDFSTGRSGAAIPSFITNFIKFRNNELSFDQFSKSLRTVEDPETLSELWNDVKGTYTWNFDNQVWDENLGGDKFIVKFPSTESATTNDAIFTIHKYVGVEIKNQSTKDDLEYSGDLPGEFLADLVVDGTKELEYSLNVSYDSEDIPSSIKTSFYANPFKYTVNYSHSSTKLSVSYSLTSNDKNILSSSIEINGKLDYESISNAGDDLEGLDLGTAKYDVQVMEVKLELTVENIEKVINDINDLMADEGEQGFDYEVAADQMDEILNSNSTIFAYFTDTKQKIADGQYKSVVVEDEYWGDKWIEPSIELVFSDETKVAFEDYIESGFETLDAEFNELVDDLEAEYN